MSAKVLVVDDEKAIRITFREFLDKAGYDVSVAEDADGALGLLKAESFDVVVSDIILPRMNGIALLRAIREAAPHVQVIMMTGDPTVETASDALRAGAFDYLFKPIGKDALLKVVATASRMKALEDEKRRLLAANITYQEHLETLVEERTAALSAEIAERKRAEEAALQAVGDWENTFDSVSDAITLHDKNFNILRGNKAAREMLGPLLLDFMPEVKCFRSYHGAEMPPVGCPSCQCLETELPGTFEMFEPYLKKTLEVRAMPRFDNNHRLVGLVHVVRDITERKQLAEERMLLSMAVDQAAEAIVVTDADGVIEYVNPAFLGMTGYDRSEVVGQTPKMLESGKQDAAFYRNLWSMIRGGAVWAGHFVNMRKDGTLFEVEATISPVFGDQGHILNYVAVERDVTEHLSLERQLRQTQKMEAIGTLAGGIAHDFNNILAAVVGYAQLAVGELPPDGALRHDLDQILVAADRAKDLVRQILTFSRRGEEERMPIQPHYIVQEALKLLRPSLPSTIEIRANINKKSGVVLADPTQLHQVIMNLCTNAYHAMKTQGGVLDIELQPCLLDSGLVGASVNLCEGEYVRLTVRDTGCGMDLATINRIFEPFFTTKPAGEGTGMGLAIVYGTVHAHGGAIAVNSTLGQGTTFDVYLPQVLAECHNLEPVDESMPGGHERILVVDDEWVMTDVLTKGLTVLGYQVTSFISSLDALKAVQADPDLFDLVITDQTMPKMTGTELVVKIHEVRPALPVIWTTGTVEDNMLEEATCLGFSALIKKPAALYVIAQTVRRVLDN